MEHNLSKMGFLSRGTGLVLMALIFLLPIFFIPGGSITLQFAKGFLAFVGVLATFIVLLVQIINDGKVSFPKSWTMFTLALLPIVYIVASLFSKGKMLSLVGMGFEMDTALAVLIAFILALLPTMIIKSKQAAFGVYLSVIFSFLVVALFWVIRLFGGADFLSMGVFNSRVSNLIGGWNDFGVFAGFMVILSLISIQALDSNSFWKTILRVCLVLGTILLAVVNLNILWYLVGFFALASLVYSLSFARVKGDGHPKMKKVIFEPLFVILVGIVFMYSTSVPTYVLDKLNIRQAEVRLTWATTMQIASHTLSEKPVFGSGPNHFVNQWSLYKPSDVNNTMFWNIDFNSGAGTIPSALVTLGALGGLFWIIFLFVYFFEGIRGMRKINAEASHHYLAVSSFVSATYFWLVNIFYTPTTIAFLMAFLMTGLFVTALSLEGIVKEKTITFGNNPANNFAMSLLSIVLIIVSAIGIYFSGQRLLSYMVFNRAMLAYAQDGNLDKAEMSVLSAATFEQNDSFYRTLSQVYLTRMNSILNQADVPKDELQKKYAQFEEALKKAVISAGQAVVIDGSNYQNHLALANVYASVVPFPLPYADEAYKKAKESLTSAMAVNPTNPSIPLSLAQLEVFKKNYESARGYLKQALALKSNYTDATYLLAQIEITEGNTEKAIKSLQDTAALTQGDANIYFQLGFLQYSNKDYAAAVKSLENSVSIRPDFANAKYFLGLSYAYTGENEKAISQFTDLKKTNPDNQEVKSILDNLTAGKDPFAKVAPPDNKPEKRKKLPVSERN